MSSSQFAVRSSQRTADRLQSAVRLRERLVSEPASVVLRVRQSHKLNLMTYDDLPLLID